ncbi:MAG: beta-N-acetylhexosaminidase [Bdellovibrionales bacterium CG12_big_fil_rev_8_21_14_0_65_38_15]|nr:MAG: beta-N-acetylhexosaminidase [Bdellovibrionales bacterium CG22_combo_CG10-13_8_21_14_all_38_13]PIQ54371.1 MAG: beta-N-acetylhexosaminidase [Bdellovibrionales bacterium CG12_big_fil_rev_8_21_14_0_65_38_15]PIR28704.1 MAG: beta-N-acetylhexosaminidase [Bdellovibrionales bacterium CG11_big_fil_rev_8_21_14_0_20_38_13]
MIGLGQLIMTGVSGLTLTSDESEFLEKENIGGVLLFAKNYDSPAQLAELVNSIQKCRREYPLIIAVDHEGGRVMRFKTHFSQFPAMMDIAKLGSPKICYHVTRIMAEELSSCGINLNMSPVCDITNNPNNKVIGDRAFGIDEESVSKYVSSAIRGFQTNGVMACAKHFPGHGCTTKDSHHDLPYVKKTIEELRETEFQPFIKAIKSRVEFVMMAHLQVDAIDEELPTSLSEKAHAIVRDEFRFKKVIISDDMQMGAIVNKFGVEDAAVKAITAGSDIIEYRDMEEAQKALAGLRHAMKVKDLKNEAVMARVSRITELKQQYLSDYKPIYIPEINKKMGLKANQIFLDDLLERIAQA